MTYASAADTTTGPSRNAFAITPHDSNALSPLPKALYVGTAGNVTLRTIDGTADVVFQNVPAGQVLLVRASHVRATGTTAGGIVGLA